MVHHRGCSWGWCMVHQEAAAGLGWCMVCVSCWLQQGQVHGLCKLLAAGCWLLAAGAGLVLLHACIVQSVAAIYQ
jgi:hypothetical protein